MGSNDSFNVKLVFAIIAAALGSGFQHGYHTGVMNTPETVLKEWINATHKEKGGEYLEENTSNMLWGVTTSIMNVGGAIGGLLVGFAAHRLGPKGALFLNNILVLIAAICMGAAKPAKSLELLIVGRLITGVNCGLNAGLCPMYLSEISPIPLRGAIASVYQLVITISILVAQIVGLSKLLGTPDSWPYLFILPLILAIFQVITLLFCTESPRYLLSVKGNIPAAEASLKFLRMTDDVGQDLAEIKHEDDHIKSLPKVTLKDMFRTRSYKVPLMIAVVLMIAQQFSGINATIFYSTTTFTKAGMDKDTAQYATIGIGVVNVTMTVISLWLVEAAGRKTLLLFAFGGMPIDTFLLAIALKLAEQDPAIPWICIVLIYIYIIIFAAGAGAIPWFLVQEIFTQAARPTAVSLAVPTNWVANVIVTLFFPVVRDAIGPLVFLIFVVLDILFFLFILKMVPETKNKTVEEIVAQWE